jgi:hypothetical protein
MNFEANNNLGGYDIILGDNADVTSAPSSVGFYGCQFTDPSGALERTAFSLNRGSGLTINDCSFINYLLVASISTNFGTFAYKGLTGITNFAASTHANTNLFATVQYAGTLQSGVTISSAGLIHTQGSSTNNIIASRRHTEAYNRFEIDATGKLGWHNFNTSALDTNLYRGSAGIVKSDHKIAAALGIGVGNSAPATETIGKSVVRKIQIFDTTGVSIGYIPVYDSIS